MINNLFKQMKAMVENGLTILVTLANNKQQNIKLETIRVYNKRY